MKLNIILLLIAIGMIHQQPAYSAGKDDTRNAELKSYDNDLNALYKKSCLN